VLHAKGPFPDRQGPLIEGFGLSVLALGGIEPRQVVEVPGQVAVLRAQGLFPDRQGLLIEGFGLHVLALGSVERPQFVEGPGQVGVLWPKGPFPDRQRPLVKGTPAHASGVPCGGVPFKVLIDNPKTAVLKHPSGEKPLFHPRYLDFAAHYGFEPRACNVQKPNEKGPRRIWCRVREEKFPQRIGIASWLGCAQYGLAPDERGLFDTRARNRGRSAFYLRAVLSSVFP